MTAAPTVAPLLDPHRTPPAFEGQPVEGVRIKVAGLSSVALPDDVLLSTDDRIRMVGEFRVVAVRHFIDDKTGQLVREQVVRPILLEPCPFDPSDPTDDGVVRAPRVGRGY